MSSVDYTDIVQKAVKRANKFEDTNSHQESPSNVLRDLLEQGIAYKEHKDDRIRGKLRGYRDLASKSDVLKCRQAFGLGSLLARQLQSQRY